MKALLNTLFEYKTLSKSQAKEVLVNIANEKYNTTQVASFMSVYLMRAITVDELSGFREAMLELCTKVNLGTKELVDIVGTGGDGKDTFNISTLSCFVVAGAGYKVAKHGNYGVSSISGSSNVLEAIGYKFSNNIDKLKKELDLADLCFMHAPLFHPAMKSVAPIRKEMGVRTFFNMVGPLVNPASPKYQVLGTFNLEMMRLYNYLLQPTETEYSIVHSFDGYDEISLTGNFKLTTKQSERILSPEDLGLKKLNESELKGGERVNDAARLFLEILNGNGSNAQNDVVAINSACAIQCVAKEKSLEECYQIALETILSKRAFETYKKLIQN